MTDIYLGISFHEDYEGRSVSESLQSVLQCDLGWDHSLQLPGLKHLLDDVQPSYQFPINVELGVGWPVGEGLQPLPYLQISFIIGFNL